MTRFTDERIDSLIERHVGGYEMQEPVAWREHVEQRLLTWRQRFVNKSGDQLALDDFMGQESIDDLIDFVCDEYIDPKPLPSAPDTVQVPPSANCWLNGGPALAGVVMSHVFALRTTRSQQHLRAHHDAPASNTQPVPTVQTVVPHGPRLPAGHQGDAKGMYDRHALPEARVPRRVSSRAAEGLAHHTNWRLRNAEVVALEKLR